MKEETREAFWLLFIWALLMLACCALGAGTAHAQSLSTSYNGATLNANTSKPTWNPQTSKWRYSVQISGQSNPDQGNGFQTGYIVAPPGTQVSVGKAAPYSGTETFEVASGNTFTWSATIAWSDFQGKATVSTQITSPANPPTMYHVPITLRNPWKVTMDYEIMQDGNPIAFYRLDAGQSATVDIQTYNPDSLDVQYAPEGYTRDANGNWVVGDQKSTDYQDGGSASPLPMNDNTTTSSTATGGGVLDGGGTVNDAANPINSSDAKVWQNNTNNTDTGALNYGNFREGINILDNDLQAVNRNLRTIASKTGTSTSTGSTGGNVTMDLSPITSRLDTLHNDVHTISQDRQDPAPQLSAAASDWNATASTGVTSASTAATQAKAQGDSVVGQFGAVPAPLPEVTDAPDSDSIDIQVTPTQHVSIPKNPFSPNGPLNGVMAAMATLVRQLIAWGIVTTFFIFVVKQINDMCSKPFATAPFGNSIAETINSIKVMGTGGGIGYAVKLGAYAAILAILLTMPVATMALITSGLPFTDLKGVFVAGPPTSSHPVVQKATGMANQVVPWSMLVSTPIYYVVVRLIIFPSQLFWQFFIKFLPV